MKKLMAILSVGLLVMNIPVLCMNNKILATAAIVTAGSLGGIVVSSGSVPRLDMVDNRVAVRFIGGGAVGGAVTGSIVTAVASGGLKNCLAGAAKGCIVGSSIGLVAVTGVACFWGYATEQNKKNRYESGLDY